MSLGDPYALLVDLKNYLTIPVDKVAYDLALTDALNSASREIENHCNRQFNKDASAAQRVFIPTDLRHARVDDFWTTSGLIVETDPGGTGNFTETWDSSDYELYPANGVVDGHIGWPYNSLKACAGLYFPRYVDIPFRREQVLRVTAQWGWASVPAPVRQACLILAAQTFKLADAPFGVAGSSEYGVVRVRDLPQVCSKLRAYVRDSMLVA